jgi:GNAT superfamily N-acetyltransferase
LYLHLMKEIETMEKLKFVQVQKDNEQHFFETAKLWIAYIQELSSHDGTNKAENEIIDNLRKRIGIQGKRSDMHLEIAYLNDEPIGIANFAIDLGTIYDLIESGYGTVMEFYIKPEFRRKGLGKEFINHIENVLRNDGAKYMYICPDPVTGEQFWKAMGFVDSGKIDPDNKLPIYTKNIAFGMV